MLRTRLLWFTLGFSVSGAASAQFVWRDLLNLASDMKHKFDALEARVQNLENIGALNSNPNLSQMKHNFDPLEARVQNLENIGAPNSNSNPNLSQVED